jgi:hypothetical protein
VLDVEEVMDRQDEFVANIVEEYGSQTFYVRPADLLLTLTDVHYRIETYGLEEPVPEAMAETLGVPASQGTVETLIRWVDDQGFLVGVFPIFPEEE